MSATEDGGYRTTQGPFSTEINRWAFFNVDELGMLLEGLDELREQFPTALALDDAIKTELEQRAQ